MGPCLVYCYLAPHRLSMIEYGRAVESMIVAPVNGDTTSAISMGVLLREGCPGGLSIVLGCNGRTSRVP